MKIGLLDADLMDHGTRHPNLALMKIAGYYKDKGDEVALIYHSYSDVHDYDEIFISKVFTFSDIPKWILNLPNVHIGGTGFFENGGKDLPEEIEHHKPYYDLYKEYVEKQIENGRNRVTFADYLDYSIGFTTRGCFRKCAFCVNKKYDRVHRHSPVSEFYDPDKPYIYLWDDNILAFPQWEEVLDDLEKTGKPFQFRQGIDLRLMTDRKAYRFNHTHYHGDFIFAFDHLKDKQRIIEKVQLWKRYSSRVCKMYVLSGFDSQDEKDIESVFERISVLMKYGSLPYIMRYEKYKESRFKGMYIELARWCNQPQFFKKKSFREFCVANQECKKNKETNCAAYQTMLDFEQEFPEIARKYFDLRFDRENIYQQQYGYGRRYENKPLCSQCKTEGTCWTGLIQPDEETEKRFLQLYFTKKIDLECLRYSNSECKDKELISEALIRVLLKYSIEEILELISSATDVEPVTKENIPQYSDLEDASYGVNKILIEAGEELIFEDLGYYLEKKRDPNTIKTVALKKYGENHAKLATLMDLAIIGKRGIKSKIVASVLGESIYKLDENKQAALIKKLFIRIPIVQNVFRANDINQIDKDLDVLSVTTKKRRRSNVINVVRSIVEDNEELSKKIGLQGE
ncbi:MAG: hypothetical protein PHD70_10420 [Anaerostipes sp.]|nr:hypothetical protein [Anaerostipes sp.]